MRLSDEIKEFIYDHPSMSFTAKTLYDEFRIVDENKRSNVRQMLRAMVKNGEINKRKGFYKYIDGAASPINWKEANANCVLDIKWPFGLENYFVIYPRNIAILAGAPNSGKTTFCFDFIKKNQDKFTVNYFNSEMGAEEMKLRLGNHEDMDLHDWKFNAYDRTEDFADVIKPDEINIIDYLEITDNFYRVADEVIKLYENLGRGMVLMCIQKNPSKGDQKIDLGRGGSFGMEKPRLYMAMDSGTLKIVKAKNWKNHSANPNGMQWSYKTVGGACFTNIQKL